MTNTIKLLFLKSQVVVFLLIPFVNYAQNVGVNQENPTNTLHVTPQNPVRFEWKEDEKGEKKIGFIAQELMEVLPETVKKGNDKNETMGVYYADIIPVLTKAIQQQQELIEKQQQEIESLKAESERNESLRVLIDKQSKDIELLHEHISSIQSIIEGGQVQIEEKDVVSQD